MEPNDCLDLERLSTEEWETLRKFREHVKDILKPYQDSTFLLRWLRARNFDIGKAEDMLRKHVNFYKSLGMESMNDYVPPEALIKYSGLRLLGKDKTGNPVYLYLPGITDYKGLSMLLSYQDLARWLMYTTDKALSMSSIGNMEEFYPGKRIISVLDLSGMRLRSFIDRDVLRFQRDIVNISSDHFPELLGACYFINAPAYVYVWYSIVRNFFNPVTASKVKIYGTEGWLPELLEIMDEDVLPEFLGGKRPDTDGLSNWYYTLRENPVIPQHFFLDKLSQSSPHSDTVEVSISPACGHTRWLCITECGSIIQWQFQTDHDRINFAIYRMSSDEDKLVANGDSKHISTNDIPVDAVLVKHMNAVECHMSPKEGKFLCEKPGSYILYFGNSSNTEESTKLFYKVKCISPSQR